MHEKSNSVSPTKQRETRPVPKISLFPDGKVLSLTPPAPSPFAKFNASSGSRTSAPSPRPAVAPSPRLKATQAAPPKFLMQPSIADAASKIRRTCGITAQHAQAKDSAMEKQAQAKHRVRAPGVPSCYPASACPQSHCASTVRKSSSAASFPSLLASGVTSSGSAATCGDQGARGGGVTQRPLRISPSPKVTCYTPRTQPGGGVSAKKSSSPAPSVCPESQRVGSNPYDLDASSLRRVHKSPSSKAKQPKQSQLESSPRSRRSVRQVVSKYSSNVPPPSTSAGHLQLPGRERRSMARGEALSRASESASPFGTPPLQSFGARGGSSPKPKATSYPRLKPPQVLLSGNMSSTNDGSSDMPSEDGVALIPVREGAGFHFQTGIFWPIRSIIRAFWNAFYWFRPPLPSTTPTAPMTLIANERTLLEWQKCAVWLVLVTRGTLWGGLMQPCIGFLILFGAFRNWNCRRAMLYYALPLGIGKYDSVYISCLLSFGVFSGILIEALKESQKTMIV